MNQMIALRTAKSNLSRIVTRNFCRTTTLRKEGDVAKSEPTKAKEAPLSGVESIRLGSRSHAPNNLEKRFLVWSGRYKSVGDIPPTVPEEAIEKARNKARIRIANFMMVATIIGCIVCIISGKHAASRGESVHKMNLDWHRQYNESHPAEASK
ncbi:UPF0389 protein GA21628 isoform X1 [Cloeon dipterum]|uniref:UPF0389 protein GA21628 isoform X1 n=2 Tax=Cloeon dipterum TaxID=197152 RepID=UPI0032200F89